MLNNCLKIGPKLLSVKLKLPGKAGPLLKAVSNTQET